MANNRLLTEILRPKKVEQLILPPRIKSALGDGSLKQNFLFYGSPGTGKCLYPESLVTVRNKKTGEIKQMSMNEIFLYQDIQKTNKSSDI